MPRAVRLAVSVVVAVTAVTATLASSPSVAAEAPREGGHDAVFVQTDNPAGNQVVAYHRGEDGQLTQREVYDTGGQGGKLDGSMVDHLASQGSLTYDPEHALLYAANAGSNTVTVFAVDGDRLTRRQVVDSGGCFPVSVAVRGDSVFVLNALDGGSVQGFTVHDGRLDARPDRHRDLGLDPNATPQFTNTPGQVGFTGDGRQLVVTTKANGNNLDVFDLAPDGTPAATPTVTNLPGAVPFAFVPNGPRGLFLTEAGPNALATLHVHHDGTATQQALAATNQSATCWVTRIGDLLYVSNAGSSTVTTIRATDDGHTLTPLGNTPTDPGTVDTAATHDGHYLYVQTGGNGIVDEFAVQGDGSLTALGSVTVPDAAGGEGIVAF
ncbi:lactonase family protein [Kitasatospora viridis]|uniref:6-phosphogluconolactonase (Cycloisomerase 2 family) n=1 Tax=Kitasatospora viridis TaxID=281105 RepID=A0A561TV95_9ACTN|nr:beta-propeller fold lactonase family protein [Kitasatospora viridis]TWF91034.1 6-phosphogluconolactonase (cycloisomerase 2 family) [Kitasatospora viridis]